MTTLRRFPFLVLPLVGITVACGGDVASSPDEGGGGRVSENGDSDSQSTEEPSPVVGTGGRDDGGATPVSNCDEGAGEQRQRCEATSVAYGEDCRCETQERACSDGVWTEWSGAFGEDTCVVGEPADCDGEANGSVQDRVRYETDSVAHDGTCTSETQSRSCIDGSWSDWSGSYASTTCVVSLPLDCETTPHDGSEVRTRYETATVPYGGTCQSESQNRTCTDGVWSSWTGGYTEVSCSVEAPADCGATPHDGAEVRIRYETPSVSYGSTCNQESQSRTCDNGTFGLWLGSFTYDSCSVDSAASCGVTPHGGSELRIHYEASTVSYGSTCNSEEQSRACDDGTLGLWSGTYMFDSCSVEAPADCVGGTHGTTEDRTRYLTASVPYGSSCSPETQSRACENGAWDVWSGTYTYDSCTVEAPEDCDGEPHGTVQGRTRYEAELMAFDEACVFETQERSCNNGIWSNWSGSYAFLDCGVDPASGVGQPCDVDAECLGGLSCRDDSVDYVSHRQCTDTCLSNLDCESRFGSSTVCLPEGVCAASCTTNDDCPNQSVCNTDSWCHRAGTGTGNPYCGGVATACDAVDNEATCGEIAGCSWGDTGEWACSPPNCGNFTNSSLCSYYGCTWDSGYNYCNVTSGMCSGHTMGTCESGTYCTFHELEGCRLTARPCVEFSLAECTTQPGCSPVSAD